MHTHLSVEQLVKIYPARKTPGLQAVAGISFAVAAGECFGLLGPNGAGKSTTIKCIVGFSPSTSGKISVLGHNVATHPKQARAKMGVCSQEDTLDNDFCVLDQLVRYASYFRIPKDVALPRAERLLEQFNLSDKARDMLDQLSGGMRRRLQVARALINDPSLVILDEPTTGLDPEARRNLWDILQTCRQNGVSVLLCTHYMDEAERLCDRIAVVDRGRIRDVDTPQQLIARHVPTPMVEEQVRPGVVWRRPANIEDVYLKLTGFVLSEAGENS